MSEKKLLMNNSRIDRPKEHTGSGSRTWPAFQEGEKNIRPRDAKGHFIRDQREIKPDDLFAVDDFKASLLRDLKIGDESKLNAVQAVGIEILMMRFRFLKGLRRKIDEKGLLEKNTDTDVSGFVSSYMQHSKEFVVLMLKLFPQLGPGDNGSEHPSDGLAGMSEAVQ